MTENSKTSAVHFDVEQERKAAWVRAAQRDGMKLVPWITSALDSASNNGPGHAPPRNRLRLIRQALRLSHNDIARACAIGGMPEVTASRVRAWLVNPDATKIGVRGQVLKKHRAMIEAELDAFLNGLRDALDEIDGECDE